MKKYCLFSSLQLSFFLFILTVAAPLSPSSAEIRVTAEMSVIEKEITEGTLTVFDLDNTLIEGIETIACDAWYDYYLKELLQKGTGEKEAVGQANILWLQIQNIAEVRPVEENTIALIRRLQAKGFKVMGLTARPVQSAALTKRQLASAGIDFTKSPVSKEKVTFRIHSEAEYDAGILMVDELNKKGETLSYFLKKIKYLPKKIVFADDKRKHSENMEIEMGKLMIPFVGYQYTKTYDRTKQLDFTVSDIQLRYLGKIIPDSVAKILNSK